MSNTEELMKVFEFSERELQIWQFLRRYMEKIKTYLKNKELDEHQLVRFMLIGMFVHYRAMVHGGLNFTTIRDSRTQWPDLFSKQAIEYNNFAERPITNTQEYLQLIGINERAKINGDSLAEFVIEGRKLCD